MTPGGAISIAPRKARRYTSAAVQAAETAAARPPLFTGEFLQLWLFGFVTFFSAFQLLPTIPFRIMDLGGSKSEAGLFLALYTFACAFSAPVTGTVADHLGRRRVLISASLLFVVFSLLYGVITNLALLLAVAIAHGTCWSAILSSSAAIMTEVVPQARRTEGLAYWGLTSTAAVAVAPLVGLEVYRFGWLTLCVEMAVLSVGMALAAAWLTGGRSRSSEPFPNITDIIDWRVTLTAMSLFVISFSYGGITSYVALLSLERGIEPKSLFFTIFAVTIIITRLLTARLGDRFGAKVLLFPSVAVVPLALLLLAFVESKAALIGAAILYGAGFGGSYPAFMAYILDRTDPGRRGATFGSVLWAFDTGIGSGSLVTGLLIDAKGYAVAFAAGAVVSALSVPIFVLTSKLLERRG